MRKAIYWTAGVCLGLAILGAIAFQDSSIAPVRTLDTAPPATIDAAKDVLTAEPKIELVSYDPNEQVQWQIYLANDGSSRVGYANYVCGVLEEHGAVVAGTRVMIVDAANLLVAVQDRNLRGMGTVACKEYSVIDYGDMRPVIQKR